MRILVMTGPETDETVQGAVQAAFADASVEVLGGLSATTVARLRLSRPDVVILSQDVDPGDRPVDAWVPDVRVLTKRLIVLSVPAPPTDPLMRAAADAGADVVLADPDRRLPLARLVAVLRQASPDPGESSAPPAPSGAASGPSDRVRQLVAGWRQWRPGRSAIPLEWDEAAADPPPRPKPTRRPPAAPRVMAVRQLVAVGGLGGGRGTSRTAVYLAQALSAHGNVLLMDWDGRGGLAPWMGEPPSDRVWEALRAGSSGSSGSVELVWDWTTRLWELGPHWAVLTASGRWPERALSGVDVGLVQDVLAWGLAHYDFVVVDVGSDWADRRAQRVYQEAQKAVLCVGTPESDAPRAQRWLAWAEAQGWPVAHQHVWVGRGSDRAWRQAMRTRYLADWDRDAPDAVGTACAAYVMAHEARLVPGI